MANACEFQEVQTITSTENKFATGYAIPTVIILGLELVVGVAWLFAALLQATVLSEIAEPTMFKGVEYVHFFSCLTIFYTCGPRVFVSLALLLDIVSKKVCNSDLSVCPGQHYTFRCALLLRTQKFLNVLGIGFGMIVVSSRKSLRMHECLNGSAEVTT
eukprot:373545-Amphidinium_carterae.1